MKDYYRILNIRERATDDELKRSYRMLAKRFHPDVSKEENAVERFAAVNEAYGVLSDPVKRAEYDMLLAKEREARPSPEKIIAQRHPSRATVKKSASSQQEHDDLYLQRLKEYAARREAARRETEERAAQRREAERVAADPSVIIAQQQVAALKAQAQQEMATLKARAQQEVATVKAQAQQEAATLKAQAQEQARRFNEQLAVAEKRAHEMGFEEGKREAFADLNTVNGELRSVMNENSRLRTEMDDALRDRQELESELVDRDRRFAEQKKRASELEKQLASLKMRSVERTELTAVNIELRSANSELRAARMENANLKRMIDATQKARDEIEKRLASNAELKAKADRLQKQVDKLESEQSAAKVAGVKNKILADELRAKIVETQGQILTLERDNDELAENLRRAQEAYEKERARAEKERERAEKAARAALAASTAPNIDADKLSAKIAKTQERLVTLERDNDELAENLRRAQEAYEKERERAEQEFARAEKERERAEKAAKRAAELDDEQRRLKEIAETKYDESVSEINTQLAEEKKRESELKETLQKLNMELEKERDRARIERDPEYGTELEINRLTFSAEAGDINAQNALGELYLYGKNENYELALHWFKEAAKKKHPDAMYNVGICYINGAGVSKNHDTGMGFMRMAARLGSEKAQHYLNSVASSDRS